MWHVKNPPFRGGWDSPKGRPSTSLGQTEWKATSPGLIVHQLGPRRRLCRATGAAPPRGAVQYAKRQARGLTLAHLGYQKVGDLQGALHGLRECARGVKPTGNAKCRNTIYFVRVLQLDRLARFGRYGK